MATYIFNSLCIQISFVLIWYGVRRATYAVLLSFYLVARPSLSSVNAMSCSNFLLLSSFVRPRPDSYHVYCIAVHDYAHGLRFIMIVPILSPIEFEGYDAV